MDEACRCEFFPSLPTALPSAPGIHDDRGRASRPSTYDRPARSNGSRAFRIDAPALRADATTARLVERTGRIALSCSLSILPCEICGIREGPDRLCSARRAAEGQLLSVSSTTACGAVWGTTSVVSFRQILFFRVSKWRREALNEYADAGAPG